MVLLSRIAAGCFILALPMFLITSNVRFLASDTGFYRHGFREYHADQVTGVSMADLDRAAGEIVSYFEDDSTTLRVIVSQDGQETSLFNARETEHMKDVKKLMRFLYRANEVSLAVVLAYVVCVFLWARERSLRTLAVQSIGGVGLGFAVVAVIGGFALTGFDAAWTRFHEIVFNNDLWLLNPATDHLIQMFPEGFWQESTVIVGALTLLEAAAIVVGALAYLIASRPKPAPEARPGLSPAVAPALPPTE
jgi:integral membrane protein (TIGR01906 family)